MNISIYKSKSFLFVVVFINGPHRTQYSGIRVDHTVCVCVFGEGGEVKGENRAVGQDLRLVRKVGTWFLNCLAKKEDI